VADVRADLIALSDYVYERIRDRLDGLTDTEYFWEPRHPVPRHPVSHDAGRAARGRVLLPAPRSPSAMTWSSGRSA
jgi:hypothetical protein